MSYVSFAHYMAISPTDSKFLSEVWAVCDLPLTQPAELTPG